MSQKKITSNDINATGTPSSTTFLRGDNTWVDPAISGNFAYTHTQAIASSTWIINHNLGYKPGGIITFDSANTQWFGNVIYIDDNNLTVDFNGNIFGGTTYIS